MKKYKLEPGQYERMLDEQHGRCLICGRPPKSRRLCVDHDHRTGKIRGLLCYQCNRFLIKGAELAVKQDPLLWLGVVSLYLRGDLPPFRRLEKEQ